MIPRSRAQNLRSSLRRRSINCKDTVPTVDQLFAFLKTMKDCYYCQCKLSLKILNVDHKLPLNSGGDSQLNNLVLCCKSCNSIKGSLDEEEYRLLITLLNSFKDGGKSVKARLKRGGRFS